MAMLDELKIAYLVMLKVIGNFFGHHTPLFFRKYVRIFFVLTTLVVLLIGGYVGYRWYIVWREQNAYHTFADYVDDYQMVSKKNRLEEWQRFDSLLSFGYMQHKTSNLAPFFLALRADAQIQQKQYNTAIATLQDAINVLPDDSPIGPLFKTKRALLLLDSSDEVLQQNGLQEIVQLARDKNNHYNDIALFYLGRYYWAKDALKEAKTAWQELVDNNTINAAYPSPWASQAQTALNQIS